MTNIVKIAYLTTRQIYDATAYVSGVYFVWSWIMLPAATMAASALLFLAVMMITARLHVEPWRNSPLGLLFLEIDSELKGAMVKTVSGDKAGPEMSDHRVTLQED